MKATLFIITLLALGACTQTPMETNPTVVFETTQGTFTVELYPEAAPQTVANFRTYVEDGFYENTIFHRIIPGFVVQGGGFEPGGERKDTRPPIPLEANLPNERGTLSMARTNVPDSGTSQFYINLQDNNALNPSSQSKGYAVFGKVIEGMDVVDTMAQTQTRTFQGQRDWPVEDIIVTRAYEK